MDIKNCLRYDEEKLMIEFIELLYKEKLSNKETYHNTKGLFAWNLNRNDAFLYSTKNYLGRLIHFLIAL